MSHTQFNTFLCIKEEIIHRLCIITCGEKMMSLREPIMYSMHLLSTDHNTQLGVITC